MERWNNALNEIEEHLEDDIDVSHIARTALTSEYHFRRVFSALAGMPLSEYVRRRRLTLAAAVVLEGRETVQDIAVRYGYTSADAFARAFKAMHGVGPDRARKPGVVLRSQSRLSFHLKLEGSHDVEYRIVTKDAFRLVGLKTRIPLVYEGPNRAMVDFEEAISEDDYERIAELSDQEPRGCLSVCHDFDETRAEGTDFDYYVAAATTRSAPEGFDTVDVAAGTWVVFRASGPFPEAVQQLWPQAYREWFPANPYQLVPGPEIVRADVSDDGSHADAELWLAVEPTS